VQAIAPRPSRSELDAGSYISSSTHLQKERTKSLRVVPEKHSIWGSNSRRKKLVSLLARFVPRGGIRCKDSFPASRRVGQASASSFCGFRLLSMRSFAELTRSMDPTVTRLAFGQLDRSQSLLDRRFLSAFLLLLQVPRQQLVISSRAFRRF
jgi:hypothetical protein